MSTRTAAAPLPSPPKTPNGLLYLGTPDIAVPPLRALVASGQPVVAVVTGEPKRRGRGGGLSPSPVHAAADELGIEVVHDLDAGVDLALDRGADLGVVVAYGQLLRRRHLARLPMVNLHFSLLPRWRGAAPVERAILAGDADTGVAVMGVELGLDTGPIYSEVTEPIAEADTATALAARLSRIGAEMLVTALSRGLVNPRPQVGEPVYAHKLSPDDFRLRWTQPAIELERILRVAPGWTTFRDRRLRVIAAEAVPSGPPAGQLVDDIVGCTPGGLRLVTVQPEGRAPQDVAAWRNGQRPAPGEAMGQ